MTLATARRWLRSRLRRRPSLAGTLAERLAPYTSRSEGRRP